MLAHGLCFGKTIQLLVSLKWFLHFLTQLRFPFAERVCMKMKNSICIKDSLLLCLSPRYDLAFAKLKLVYCYILRIMMMKSHLRFSIIWASLMIRCPMLLEPDPYLMFQRIRIMFIRFQVSIKKLIFCIYSFFFFLLF